MSFFSSLLGTFWVSLTVCQFLCGCCFMLIYWSLLMFWLIFVGRLPVRRVGILAFLLPFFRCVLYGSLSSLLCVVQIVPAGLLAMPLPAHSVLKMWYCLCFVPLYVLFGLLLKKWACVVSPTAYSALAQVYLLDQPTSCWLLCCLWTSTLNLSNERCPLCYLCVFQFVTTYYSIWC